MHRSPTSTSCLTQSGARRPILPPTPRPRATSPRRLQWRAALGVQRGGRPENFPAARARPATPWTATAASSAPTSPATANGVDYFIDNIVDPNAVVGVDFQLNVLTLKDGSVLSGMVERETETAYVVRTPTETRNVAKGDVKSREVLAQSLMPAGLLETTTRKTRVIELLMFLTDKPISQLLQHRHRRPRLRRGIHPHLPAASRRANMYAICQRTPEEAGRRRRRLRHREALHGFRGPAEGSRTSMPSTSTRPSPITAGRRIAALKAGKHVACTVPMATSIEDCKQIVELVQEDRPQIHDGGDRRLCPRVSLHEGAATTRASSARSSSSRRAISRTWTAGRTTGPACRRCGTPRIASGRSAA